MTAPTQALQRHFMLVHERDNNTPVICHIATLYDDGIAVENAGIHHRVA